MHNLLKYGIEYEVFRAHPLYFDVQVHSFTSVWMILGIISAEELERNAIMWTSKKNPYE